MWFLDTEQLTDSEDLNFFNYHFKIRWEKEHECCGPDRQFSPAPSREWQFGETWAVKFTRQVPLSLSTCLHHPDHSLHFLIFFFLFFSEKEDSLRHLLLLDTDSKWIKKREERSNNTPRSPQRRENFRQPRKEFPRVRLGPGWAPGCGTAPGWEQTPAASPSRRNSPALGCGILAHLHQLLTERQTEEWEKKERKTPSYLAETAIVLFSPQGKSMSCHWRMQGWIS